MRGIGLALFIALMAALANSLFAYGNRRADVSDAPFAFVAMVLAFAFLFCLLAVLLLPNENVVTLLTQNLKWALYSGLGLAVTLVGFYFLYANFGATYYALYSVMAILTTTVLVGQILLKEPITVFHVGAIVLAMGSVVLFTLGQARLAA